jgi:hypothetical protein
LRQWLSDRGVSVTFIDKLLHQHTPTQIERGFERLQDGPYSPDQIAGIITRGRFGYRKGMKEKLAKPKGRKGAEPLSVPAHDTAEEEALLRAYLESGTLPPPP